MKIPHEGSDSIGGLGLSGRRKAAIVGVLAVVAAALSVVGAAAAQAADVSQAMARIEEGTPAQRARAADVLGRQGAQRRDEVVPLLRRHLRGDEDWRVRASSGRALGRLAARDAVPDLVRALRDPVVDVRVVAAAAIWRLPDPAAVPALLELLEDDDAAARQWGALALGVIRDRRATRPLIALLADAEGDVRLDAIRSLGRLRDPAAAAALEAHAADDGRASAERLEAVNALSSLGGPEKVDALVRLLRADDADVRQRAAQGLGRVGDALVIPPLRERRADERNAAVRGAIDAAIAAIRARLERGDEPGRGAPLDLPPLP